MLSEATRTIVKATVPALEAHGSEITQVFYRNMFAAHPELLDIFNTANQGQGRQQTALAATVLAAAKNIDHLEALLPQVSHIANKHRALQVRPEHYPIVGEHLLGAIRQVLGDAATPEILAAWGEAYGAIADVFIATEQNLYQAEAWQGFADFTVTERRDIGSEMVEFTVSPTAVSLPAVRAGQYITVQVRPEAEGHLALRHYSICSTDTASGLKFAVKRENADGHRGLVSHYLHDKVQVGDTLKLSAPAGDFCWENGSHPVVFLSAGIGITPLLAMLQAQVEADAGREIVWLHAAADEDAQAFKAETAALLSRAQNAVSHVFYSGQGQRMTPEWLKTHTPDNATVYLCGSMAFMDSMAGLFESFERPQQSVRFEPFGPKMSVAV